MEYTQKEGRDFNETHAVTTLELCFTLHLDFGRSVELAVWAANGVDLQMNVKFLDLN